MNRKQFLRGIAVTVVFHKTLWGGPKNYTLEYQWKHLTPYQKSIRDRAYAAGLQAGLEESLTAIAWQESSFGLPSKMENPKDPSGGVFGNSYRVVARRHFNLGWITTTLGMGPGKIQDIVPTDVQLEFVRKKLLTDFSFSAHHSIWTLTDGKNKLINIVFEGIVVGYRQIRNEDWTKIWSYYNGGHKGNEEYALQIRKKVRFMKTVKYKG